MVKIAVEMLEKERSSRAYVVSGKQKSDKFQIEISLSSRIHV